VVFTFSGFKSDIKFLEYIVTIIIYGIGKAFEGNSVWNFLNTKSGTSKYLLECNG